MRKIIEIIIHCSATPEGRDYTIKDIDRWHREKGYKSIGYHYVIYRNGEILKGRAEEEIGAHCYGHNKNSIGVCYIGGLSFDNKTPKDTRTKEQKEALIKLIKELKIKYPEALVLGHRDTSPDLNHNGKIEPKEFIKSCPSFNAKDEYIYIK